MIRNEAMAAQVPTRCSPLGNWPSLDSVYDTPKPQSNLPTLPFACAEPWPKVTVVIAGLNVFWRRHVPVRGLDVETDVPAVGGTRPWGDGVETLINICIAHAGLKVTEVLGYEHSRIDGLSNLNAAREGWRVLRTILVERYYNHWQRAAQSKNPSESPTQESGLCG